MEYPGPTADDLENINALNRFFLAAVADSATGVFGALAERRLTQSQLSRLADAPFLLFSFREQDGDYWTRILADRAQIDLIDSGVPPTGKIRQLQVAGLGFLWQLSRRNAYAARIVSGAPVSWCERLAGQTLVSLLDRVATRGDLLVVRFPDEDDIWHRLLGSGVSSKRDVRRSSQHSALQALLTRGTSTQYNRVAAAACRIREK